MWLPRGREGGEGMNWEFEISSCKLLLSGQTMGFYCIQYPVINHDGKEYFLKEYIYICNMRASQVALMVENLPANAGNIRDAGSISESGRSPGGGHGNPLQYSCLENPMDRGAWRATVHRVTKNWTLLKGAHICDITESLCCTAETNITL